MELYTADWIHHQGTFRAGHALLVDEGGRIAAAGPLAEVEAHPGAAGAARRDWRGSAIAPGTISAHSHSFQVMLRGAADHPSGFKDWVRRHLYPLVESLDDAALEAAATLCFAQMARAGVTSVGEFHYVHNERETYADRSTELARVVIGAARRVGLRVGFLRAIYDVQERHGQGRMAQDTRVAADRTRELAKLYRDDPFVRVLPAPHSLHGTTREGVELGAALAEELDTRWHIHLAEQKSDVGFAQNTHQGTPLEVLDRWGILTKRTVVVHGIWLGERERALLGERGAALVSNPTTNMALGDGICELSDLVDRGVTVALGTDMNAAPNVFEEMRIAEYLQRVKHLRMSCLSGGGSGRKSDPARVFAMGTRNGAKALGLETGELAPGLWADLLRIDLEDPSLLPAAFLGGDALLNQLASGMVPETAIRDVLVAGKAIVSEREVVGAPRAELKAKLRGLGALAARA